MTEKQLFYPLLSVYFSLILGDLQKEKLQIVSIFRFGHKKRGLFQCPPKGGELIPSVFEAVGSSSLSLGKVGMGLRTKAMYGWFIVDGVHPDNAVGVALSRRRYPHQLNASVTTADNSHHDSHRHGFLCFHSSNDNQPLNTFFYAHLHTFCPKSVEV